MDKHVGRIARSGRKRHLGGSGTCKRCIAPRRKIMSQFEKFVAEGNEKADELAKAGAMLNKGFMAEAKAETLQQEERRGACSTGSIEDTRSGKLASNRVAFGNRQVSVHEMWKRK